MTFDQPATSRRSEQPQLRVHIRWMIRRDMAEVLEIERAAFEFPWFEEEFIRCLRQRNCIGMVAEHAERVVGFMIYELHKTRLHILNFAVAPAARRLGIGAQMIDKLVNKLSQQRRHEIVLEVRETNLAAQLFFRTQFAVRVLVQFVQRQAEVPQHQPHRFVEGIGRAVPEAHAGRLQLRGQFFHQGDQFHSASRRSSTPR